LAKNPPAKLLLLRSRKKEKKNELLGVEKFFDDLQNHHCDLTSSPSPSQARRDGLRAFAFIFARTKQTSIELYSLQEV